MKDEIEAELIDLIYIAKNLLKDIALKNRSLCDIIGHNYYMHNAFDYPRCSRCGKRSQ